MTAGVIDSLDRTLAATVQGEFYLAVLDEPREYPDEIIVCCRDASGTPVRRLFPYEHTATTVTDATVPCPGCGQIDYEECERPLRNDRSGEGMVNGERVPSRSVCCRVCGQTWHEGVFYTHKGSSRITDDQRAANIEESRARRDAQLRSILIGLDFPVYAVQGRPAWYLGCGTDDARLSDISVGHHLDENAAGRTPGDAAVKVTTERNPSDAERSSERLRRELKRRFARILNTPSTVEGVSHAELTLRNRAFDRACRAEALRAEQWKLTVMFSDRPEQFDALTSTNGMWAATGYHNGLRITISAQDTEPSEVVFAALKDPKESILV